MAVLPLTLLTSAALASFGGIAVVASSCCGSPCGKAPPCSPTPAAEPSKPAPAEPAKATEPSKGTASLDAQPSTIHNLKRLSPRIVRGAQPEGDAAFEELARLGVKTIISVDGARPDVETAAKHGMRYVHVPHGYDGIPKEKADQLAKAFTTLEGPFFVHCHHGKHRGPAACAIGRVLLDGITPDQAVAEMKEAGTAAKYKGLYAVPSTFVKPTAEELAAVPTPPSTARIPAFQESMVEFDQGWTRMQQVRKAGWTAPPDHPDVDPAHEATILAEHFREIQRTEDVKARSGDFRAFLAAGEAAAWDLAKVLGASPPDAKAAAAAYDSVENSCSKCHTTYRDNR
jgi:protein tyrosine phosphatase (PTP) superfamily phosphohydrolase (DUF442 family)